MKAVADTLAVARSNLIERVSRRAKSRRPYRKAGDDELLALIRRLVDRLNDAAATPQLNLQALSQLTAREKEIVGLVAHGLSNSHRRGADHQPRHGEDPRQPGHDQARGPRPRTAGRVGLPPPPRRAARPRVTARRYADRPCRA